jgi:serine/threonine-protein kinase
LLLVALLLGAVLLGGLAWALSRGPSEQGTPGAGRVEVPDVVGLSRDEATKRLEGAGLKLGSQAEAPNGEFAEGAVIDQDPAAGTEAVRGTAVDLVVSTGPAQELTPPASLSATPAASPTATATATAPPASNAEAKKRREEQRKEAAKEAEERQKEREKELKQAQEEAREDE